MEIWVEVSFRRGNSKEKEALGQARDWHVLGMERGQDGEQGIVNERKVDR